jgi:hypothetical protein
MLDLSEASVWAERLRAVLNQKRAVYYSALSTGNEAYIL